MNKIPTEYNQEEIKRIVNRAFQNDIRHKFQRKYQCAIIGCTGMAGQQFLGALDQHPWFIIHSIYANSNIGNSFREVRRGHSAFNLTNSILEKQVLPINEIFNQLEEIDLVFSAIPTDYAQEIESKIGMVKPVFTTASFFRYEHDTPIFLPIVNATHAKMLKKQQKNRGWNGFVCPGPNCTTVGAAIALFPIYQKFGLKSIHLVSMQAISGGGYPGPSSYDILGNIIPYIPNEEHKVAKELSKIFAVIEHSRFEIPEFSVDAKCNRVPVINGHLESIFFQTKESTSISEIRTQLMKYTGEPTDLKLPNAPSNPICLFDENHPDRPQPRIEFDGINPYKGMMTYIGGLEQTSLTNGYKMTVLSHNTELGAGRGGVLNAEYLVATGFI